MIKSSNDGKQTVLTTLALQHQSAQLVSAFPQPSSPRATPLPAHVHGGPVGSVSEQRGGVELDGDGLRGECQVRTGGGTDKSFKELAIEQSKRGENS